MRRKLLQIGVVLLAALLFIGCINAGLAIARNRSLRSTSDKFVAAILANDSKKSFALFTPSTQKKNPLDSTWSYQVNSLSIAFTNRKPQYVGNHPFKNFRVVEYDIKAASGVGTYRFTVTLAKSGLLGWQIDSFWSSET